MHRRRRLVAVLSTLVLTVAASAALMLTSGSAHAAESCGSPPAGGGWRVAAERDYGGAALQVWVWPYAPFPQVIRAANKVADGKRNVSVEAGYHNQDNSLGTSTSIGTAPGGGWCSSVNSGNVQAIWGALGFDVGKTHHYENVTCNNYNSELTCDFHGIN